MKKSISDALTEGYVTPVRDSLWGHIYMTAQLAELTVCAPFIRLSRILQLGPVFLVYPGATHTRASHSIGVYHLGRRLLQNLAERGADWITAEGVKSFLCACLLHDLGHFPYTHSLKELSLASHEKLTGRVILENPVKNLVKNAGADPQLSAAIVDKDLPGPAGSETELKFYRKLLSGCLDPDKLDYLNRDARYCGVTYGAQDVDFIFSHLYPDIKHGAVIKSRLIPNVEAILFSKYLMYRIVYWHRQVRSATAMIKKALITGLESGKIQDTELYNLDDQSLFVLLQEKTSGKLSNAVREGKIFTMMEEFPYDEVSHAHLRDIENRSRHEFKLCEKLRSAGIPVQDEDLIIDIPETLSFETGLFVLDENVNFTDSSSAFKPDVLDSFIKSLFTVRIFIDPDFEKRIETLSLRNDIIH